MIEQNIQNIKKMNDTNLLNQIHYTAENENNKLDPKKRLSNSCVERGENYIIFKRNTNNKRKRFNEAKRYEKPNKRALSCVGVEKLKMGNQNPAQSVNSDHKRA